MKDRFGREIYSLRISVINRCNLRCRYCVGGAFPVSDEGTDLLTFDEILRVARLMTDLGFRAFRVTGGEPLLRRGVVDFVARLKALPGVERVALSTNATILERFLPALEAAGLDGVNVSVDSLDADAFREVTGGGDLATVLRAVDAAVASRIPTVKLNVVLVKGVNDAEVDRLARLTLEKDLHVRFIEFMAQGEWQGVERDGTLAAEAVIERLRNSMGLAPDAQGVPGAGPAEYWRLPGARGAVGFIHPVSDKFCARCNRMRLTADGRFKACLLWEEYVELKPLLRGGVDDDALRDVIRAAVFTKPEKHADRRLFDMRAVGG